MDVVGRMDVDGLDVVLKHDAGTRVAFVLRRVGVNKVALKSCINPFMPTVPTFAVRETDVSRHNGCTLGASLKPLRDDIALRALSSLRALRGAP